jgi:hypothetical protein
MIPEACPEGTAEFSPGFQPWEHAQSYGTALNGRQIWIERKPDLRSMNAASEVILPCALSGRVGLWNVIAQG